MQDLFGRQITYARLSVTDLCNMRCRYCMPDGVEKKQHSDILSIEEYMFVSDVLADLGVEKQRLTGGEPLIRRGLMSLVEHMGQNEKIKSIGITTNGQRLEEMADELKDKGLNLINISIDTLDEKVFSALTGGGDLDKTIRGIDKAVGLGFDKVKLNAVLLKGVNDTSIKELVDFANGYNIEIRFIELMPFINQQCFAKQYFISTNDVVKANNLHECNNACKDDKVTYYEFDNGNKVGFISPVSHKFCDRCNRVRITADGKLLNCLHTNLEFDLKPYLNSRDSLMEYIQKSVLEKPNGHRLDEGVYQNRIMENIGG